MLSAISARISNTNQQIFKARSNRSQHDDIVMNAINTVDSFADRKESVSDLTSNVLVYLYSIPLLATTAGFLGLEIGLSKGKKNDLLKFSLLTAGSIISGILLSRFIKNRAVDSSNANKAGQDEAINQYLNKPELFVPLNEEKIKQIKEHPVYQEYANKKYENDFNLVPEFWNIKENNAYTKQLKNDAKNLKPTKVILENEEDKTIYEAVKEVDEKSQKYYSKVTSGLNQLFVLGSAASVGLAFVLEKLVQNKGMKYKIPVIILQTILASIPPMICSKLTISSFYDNVEKVGRYRAKENKKDLLKNSDISTCIDYLKTKEDYKKKIQKHDDLLSIRNQLVQTMEFSEEELKKAEVTRDSFINKINSKKRFKNLENDKLNNSMGRDFILNVLFPPLIMLMTSRSMKKNTSMTNFCLSFAGSFGLVSLLNSCLIKVNESNKN